MGTQFPANPLKRLDLPSLAHQNCLVELSAGPGGARGVIGRQRALLLAALVVGLLPLTPPARAEAPSSEPQRWEWVGGVPPGGAVRVENPFGDVRARFGGYEGKVEVHAVLQNLHPGAAPLKVFVDTTPQGVTLRVARDGGPEPGAAPGPRDRADLAVRVPKGCPFFAATTGGAIEIKGLRSDVTAQSDTGAITVQRVEGLLRTRNRQGDTAVFLGRLPPGSEQSFESVTGDLSVTLPAKADATVVARTSTWITTDISLDIVRHPREEPSKTATGKVGTGAARLRLETKRGAIQILQMDDVDQLAVTPGGPEESAPSPRGE